MNTRRIKGDGTVRKRSDGRWEGRFTDSTGKTRYIYRYSKTEVHEELKKLGYIQSVSVFDNIGGDVDFDTWFEHYCEMKALSIKEICCTRRCDSKKPVSTHKNEYQT